MSLTSAQKIALKADILANPTLSVIANNSDGNFQIAAYYNQPATPDYYVWRTSVSRREILQNGFDWTRLDNLSVGKARVWNDIFVDGTIDPSKNNVRSGIEAVWVGTAQDLAVRAAVYVHCKRKASLIQKLFSTGSGLEANPSTMATNIPETFLLTLSDVEEARNLP